MILRLGIGFLWLLWKLLPVSKLARLGEWFGGLLYYIAGARRKVAETNLGLCFPERSASQRKALLKAHFRALGRTTLLETVFWWGDWQQIQSITAVEGEEHVRPHLGKPMIWLASHFVGLNLGGVRITTDYGPCVTLYARIKEPLLDSLILAARQRERANVGPHELYSRSDGIKPVIRAIRKGLPFYYLPDMDYGRKDAIFVPFFNVPAATVTGLSRLARATGAVVVPCVTRWQDGRYVTRFYPAWDNYPTGEVEADTRRMNAFIETRIREIPEQYFWVHKRFKTQPEGDKGSLYRD